MLQVGMKKIPKIQMQEFLSEPAIQAICCGNRSPPRAISLDGLLHVQSSRAQEVTLSPSEQPALDLIDSPAQSCTVVQGPFGTGKTFVMGLPLGIRNIEAMVKTEGCKDITLVLTATNPAALNIAIAFEKVRELAKDRRFKLVLAPNVEKWASGDGKATYARLRENGHL